MSLSRRGFVIGSLGSAVGLMTASCGRFGSSPSATAGFPSAEKVKAALRDLVKKAGRETFQSVDVDSEENGGGLEADLLMPGGGVRTFTYDGRWKKYDDKSKDIFTSPVSVRIADLPLDHLNAYARAARTKLDSLTFHVDYVGRIQVLASKAAIGNSVGVKPDASGLVPHLDLGDSPADVRSAIAEIVAVYGHRAERIGSFNGFVHMDGNVAGCHAGVRIIRDTDLAAKAILTQQTPFHESRLFDPAGFDPTMAITRKATIAEEAHVKGRVHEWEYRRPPKGGAPLLSYAIQADGPETRVWLNEHGKIAAVHRQH